VNGLRVVLSKTGETSAAKPNNGYHIVPKDVISLHLNRKS